MGHRSSGRARAAVAVPRQRSAEHDADRPGDVAAPAGELDDLTYEQVGRLAEALGRAIREVVEDRPPRVG